MRGAAITVVLFGVLAGCPARVVSVTPAPAPAAAAAPIEVWVDGSVPEGGDGSRNAPLRQLGPALGPGVIVHLRSGLYGGPFTLPDGVRLVGHGEVVLYAEGETTVLTAPGAVSLEGLSVQGGFIGLDARGTAGLHRVHFSGHRRVALTASGTLTLEDAVLDGTVSETMGVQLTAGAKAVLRQLRFTGAFRRAVDATGATLTVDDLKSEGPAQALHVEHSDVTASKLAVAGGTGPAVFAAGGTLTLTDTTVNGHEYALQARKTALTVRTFRSNRVQLAAIATVDCTGTLEDLSVEQSGTYGALQLLDSTLKVKKVKVKQARTTGIFVRKGKVTLEDATVEQTRGDRDGSGGDALHVRDADVTATNLVVRDAEGVGAYASAAARLNLSRFSCERCRVGALLAELAADLTAKGVTTRGGEGPAISVLDKATATLEDADLVTTQIAIWADCDQGAHVTVRRVKSNLPLPASGCIEVE